MKLIKASELSATIEIAGAEEKYNGGKKGWKRYTAVGSIHFTS
jgi:hypothetical protein